MKPLQAAILFVLSCIPLANACSAPSHVFTDAMAGETSQAGSTGATASGGSAHAGSSSSSGAGSGASGTTDAAAGAGGDAANPECQAGQRETCWELADGTPLPGPTPRVEQGSCHIGARFCGPDSKWGPCLGAVAPKASDACDVAGNDDDCDGVPNEGCNCVNGTKRSCGSNIGSCKEGQQTCVAQAWGPCVGEVIKQALDSCITPGNDDNCNGTPNDDCPCVGTASGTCNDCGSRDCNPVNRQWGACHAAKPSSCTSATQVRDCSSDGNWVSSSCKFACADGSCTGICTPGATRCVTGPERRQTCSDAGAWATVETCASGKLCQNDGASCVTPCAGQKLCPGNVCAPLGGCCSDTDCGNNFACVNGACSTTVCQAGFNGPCGGTCTKGCCSVNDCADHPNMGRACTAAHQCTYACKTNYGNCDGTDANGCEVNLIAGTPSGSTVENCGSCGNTCNFVNRDSGDCMTLANSCAQAECLASFKPTGDLTDEFAYHCPVERPHAALHRGDCDIYCIYDCAPGYTDCNNSASDGCETASDVETGNCYKSAAWGGF